ncbi:MAG: transposase [Coriobacteriales bacterium]|nr:transposase [Coriobacteriales bacterium]
MAHFWVHSRYQTKAGNNMPRASRQLSESGYYHVVLRGIGRQILFEDNNERQVFLSTVKRYRDNLGFKVIAWCLMSNHVHLLLYDPNQILSEAVKRIALSFAKQHNKRHDHVGHVFEDRFTSKPIETNEQLIAAVNYIHNNPQKAGLASAQSYKWSSYKEYLGSKGLSDTSIVIGYLGGWSNNNESELEYQIQCSRTYITDAEAKKLITQTLSPQEQESLEGQDKEARDRALVRIKELGIAVRQIERLTGIGRNIISRAHK